MKKRKLVLLVVMMVAVLSSCSTLKSGESNENGSAIPIQEKKVEIIDTVEVEHSAYGVLGVTPEFSLFSWGQRSSYFSLLNEAKKIGADEVINIKTDIITSNTYVFYNYTTWKATGLAIKYID